MELDTENNLNSKICINYMHGNYFIWKAQDVYETRKTCRIIGTLIGCLARVPFQNTQLGLPLRLMPEEAHLLREKGFAIITSSPILHETISNEIKDKVQEIREKLFKNQNELYKEERKNTILSKADTIVAGKKRRLIEKSLGTLSKKKRKILQMQLEKYSNDVSKINLTEFGDVNIPQIEINREEVINEEFSKISDPSRESLWVQIHTECPWSDNERIEFEYPTNESERVRYLVFKDLWEQGLYLTSGHKFGGDFLAYPGNPAKFHAWYVVHCLASSQSLEASDILIKGRLGTQVRKNVILATVNSDSNIDYITLNWAGD